MIDCLYAKVNRRYKELKLEDYVAIVDENDPNNRMTAKVVKLEDCSDGSVTAHFMPWVDPRGLQPEIEILINKII